MARNHIDDVLEFLDKLRVTRNFESPDAVRLRAEYLPDALYGGAAYASHRQHSANSLGCPVGPGFSRQVNKLCRLHLLNKYSSRPNKYNSVNREALHECSSLLLRELIWKIFAILFLDLILAPPRRGLFNSVPELIQDINQCSRIKILIPIRSFGPRVLTTCYKKSFEPMIALVLKRMKHSTGPRR